VRPPRVCPQRIGAGQRHGIGKAEAYQGTRRAYGEFHEDSSISGAGPNLSNTAIAMKAISATV
jgi:hypothetical protein